MDVPSSHAGRVTEVLVAVGDTVSQGTPVLRLDAADGEPTRGRPDRVRRPGAEGRARGRRRRGHGAGAGDGEGLGDRRRRRRPPLQQRLGQRLGAPRPRRPERAQAGPRVRGRPGPGAGHRAQGPDHQVRPAGLRPRARRAGARRGAGGARPAARASPRSRRRTSRSSARSRRSRCRGSRGSRARSCTARGSTSRTSRTTTTPTSPTPTASARSSTPQGKTEGYRVTLLAFLMKASVSALKAYPTLNSSLTPEKDALIMKRYYHLGVAVDTPGGLVVPVIRDVDRKGIVELSQGARRGLGRGPATASSPPTDMSGGTFTISSLGGIGGTAFTPIVNAPEVAILGVVRSRVAPVWDGEAFVPRTAAAAVPVLRPPRHRRRPGRALHPPPRAHPGRRTPSAAVGAPSMAEATRRRPAAEERTPMAGEIVVEVPDIGDFTDVPSSRSTSPSGSEVALDEPLLTLESDKATMDVPAETAGTVTGDPRRGRRHGLAGHADPGRRRRPRDGAPATPAPALEDAAASEPAPSSSQTRPAAAATSRTAHEDRHVGLVVLGAGPGGYTAAFRAADLGLEVAGRRRPRHPRRGLPQRRLHPVEGAAARGQGHRRDQGDERARR